MSTGKARPSTTAEELAAVARIGTHLVNALALLLPRIRVRNGRTYYDWSLESRPYGWGRAMAAAPLGNLGCRPE